MKNLIKSFLILTLINPFFTYAQNNILSITGYYTPGDNNRHVIAATGNGGIQEIYFNSKKGIFEDPLACFNNIIGISSFISSDDGIQHTIVATADGNITEIFYDPHIGIHISQPALGNFKGIIRISAFFTPDDNFRHVIVATNDGNIHEIFYGPSIGVHISQPALANFGGIVDISGFYTPDDKFRHVIVATRDGNIHEIFYGSSIGVHISQPALTNFNGIKSISGFYTPDDAYRHVIVATNDGNIHEIFYNSATGVHISQPALANFDGIINIAGFYTDDDKYRHVIVATNKKEIHEIFYNSATGVHISQPALYSFRWVSVGPTTYEGSAGGQLGRVNCIAVDPVNPNILYCGTPDGGLWVNRSGGLNAAWKTLTDALSLIGVSGIAINPGNTNQIYILTGDAGTSVSSDVGSTGVMKSNDGGATWSTTALTFRAFNSNQVWPAKLVMDPANSKVLFAVTSNGIYRTADGGATWPLVQSGNFVDCAFKPGNSAIMYAVSGAHFWRSTDNGSTWTQVTTGLPNLSSCPFTNSRIGVSPANSNNVYVLYSCYGQINCCLSTDGGLSFGGNLVQGTPNYFGTQSSWCANDLTFGVDQHNSSILYAGGSQASGLYRSTDGGKTWSTTTGILHGDQRALLVTATKIYAGCDGGILYSSDMANTFTDLSAGMSAYLVSGVAGTPRNPNWYLFGDTDNGNSWYDASTGINRIIAGGDGNTAFINPQKSDTFYFGNHGTSYRSRDGGVHSTIITPNPWAVLFAMDPLNPDKIFAAGNDGSKPNIITITTNGGDSWTPVQNNLLPVQGMAVGTNNNEWVYAATANTVLLSTSGGSLNSFNTVATMPTSYPAIANTGIAVSSTDAKKVWLAFSSYVDTVKVCFSSDGGQSWKNITGSLPNVPVNCIVTVPGSPINSVYIATDIGVYYTDDNLGHWVPFRDGMPAVIVSSLYINPATSSLVAGTYGRGIWKSRLFLSPCSGR
jgi:photosystem II stability/assembly factor-like uncharacterized protein